MVEGGSGGPCVGRSSPSFLHMSSVGNSDSVLHGISNWEGMRGTEGGREGESEGGREGGREGESE